MFSAQNPYSNPVTNNNLNIKDQIMQFHQRKRMMQDLQFSATSNDYKLEDLQLAKRSLSDNRIVTLTFAYVRNSIANKNFLNLKFSSIFKVY